MHSPSHIWRHMCNLVLCVSLLVGCATTERELSQTAPPYATLPNGRDPMNPERRSTLGERCWEGTIPTMEQEMGRPLNILEMSGGGQNGAFGAGVLVGWAETGKRPKFDIVTGISVGALLSTFAFLGEPEDDAAMEEIFTTINKDDIYHEGGALRVAFGGVSFHDSEPLAKLLEKYITQRTLERVAAEARKGRMLAVGILNLDYRQLWVIEMAVLAASGAPDALDIYRKVLLAAASPPAIFPAVEIKGSLFADGGTRDRLLVAGLAGPGLGATAPKAKGGGQVYVIFNDTSRAQPRAVKSELKDILRTSVRSMLDGQMEATLVRAYGVAQIHGYQFNLLQIPNDFPLGPDPLAFDPKEMGALFERGRELGRNPDAWLKTPETDQNVTPWIFKSMTEMN